MLKHGVPIKYLNISDASKSLPAMIKYMIDTTVQGFPPQFPF